MSLYKKLLYLLILLLLLGSRARTFVQAQDDTAAGQTKVFLPFVSSTQNELVQAEVAGDLAVSDEATDEATDEAVSAEELVLASAAKPIFGAYEAWTNEPYFGTRGIFFADVNKDKRADAIVVNDASITVRRSTGSSFGAYEVGTPQPYFGNRGTFFADVNKDGRADAIVVNDAGITVRRAK